MVVFRGAGADGGFRPRARASITAGDIEYPADIEIINPELQLLTLDTLDSDLEIELVAERGVGYSPTEDRRDLPIGQIPVDAIFSPILRVRNTVEPARIEQITNYDLLKLEIWTGRQRAARRGADAGGAHAHRALYAAGQL